MPNGTGNKLQSYEYNGWKNANFIRSFEVAQAHHTAHEILQRFCFARAREMLDLLAFAGKPLASFLQKSSECGFQVFHSILSHEAVDTQIQFCFGNATKKIYAR